MTDKRETGKEKTKRKDERMRGIERKALKVGGVLQREWTIRIDGNVGAELRHLRELVRAVVEDITHADEDAVPRETLALCDGLVKGVGHCTTSSAKGTRVCRGLIVAAAAVEVNFCGGSWGGRLAGHSDARSHRDLHSDGEELLGSHSEVLFLLAALLLGCCGLQSLGMNDE